jgi:hypothetical protein
MQSMKRHLPVPTFPKTREQMAAEYDIHVRTFMRKLKRAGIQLSSGLIMSESQLHIYKTLGPPTLIWKDSKTLVSFLDPDD